jgi:hypothetical protein
MNQILGLTRGLEIGMPFSWTTDRDDRSKETWGFLSLAGKKATSHELSGALALFCSK